MSILIATPCYNGWTTVPFEASCYSLKKELDIAGIDCDFLRITNESLVTRARNVIAADFRDQTNFRYLLSVDADIEFEPAHVALLWNLCLDGADIAVGCYRHKNPDSKREAWVGGQLRPVSDFEEPFEVDYAGTGFMMIGRHVFDRLAKAHPEWEYEEGFPEADRKVNARRCVAFFQDPIADHRGGGRLHLSEDYFFVHEAKKIGFKVMMHPEVHLKHWGMFPY